MEATDGENDHVSILCVLVCTTIMAIVSGFGALPFFFVGDLSTAWAGVANALACGVMLAASFDLIHEGQPYGGTLVVVGVIIGALGISKIQQVLERYEDVKFTGNLSGASARKTLMMVGVMGAHALGEGSGVGVSFSGAKGWTHGLLVTLAIGIHNIPEGLAVSTVLAARGVPAWSCALWAVATSLPQPLLAVPSFMFVETFSTFLPLGLGISAGCMIWMVFAELMPDALEAIPGGTAGTVATFAAAGLEWFRMTIASLETPSGTLEAPVPVELLPALAGSCVPVAAGVAVCAAVLHGLGEGARPGPAAAGWLLGAAGGVAGALGGARVLLQCALWAGAGRSLLTPLLAAGVGAGVGLVLTRTLPTTLPSLTGADGEEGEGKDAEAGLPPPPPEIDCSAKGPQAGAGLVRVAAALVVALAASGGAEGLALGASAVAAPGSTIHLALPACIAAVPRAMAVVVAVMGLLASSGAGGAGAGGPKGPLVVAGLAGTLEPVAAFEVLSGWWGMGPEAVQMARAGTGGALACVAAVLVKGRAERGPQALRGAMAGAAVGCASALSTVLLCSQTPYCVELGLGEIGLR